MIKGYLHSKMITSQNKTILNDGLRHRLRIVLFHRKVMLRSRDIQVFACLTIP